jgi:predicted DCC family thiol-disulfide oxidoreductase YuxK
MTIPPSRRTPDPSLARPPHDVEGNGQTKRRTSSETIDVGRPVSGSHKVADTVATGPVTAGSAPVLLYDGLCGFCNTTVQFVLGHENRHSLRFAALQGKFAAGVKQRHPELNNVDSLVWVEGEGEKEQVVIRSAAALKVVNYMGGLWKIYLVFGIVPAPVRDFLYDLFAKHRYRFFGRYGSCPVPTADVRPRFLA